MKTKITAIPRLLGNPAGTGQWELIIKTRHESITMTFSTAVTARQIYDQIRAQGTFAGQWIATIELREVATSHE